MPPARLVHLYIVSSSVASSTEKKHFNVKSYRRRKKSSKQRTKFGNGVTRTHERDHVGIQQTASGASYDIGDKGR
jgi:transcription initiation factor IIF auxiliary subunit